LIAPPPVLLLSGGATILDDPEQIRGDELLGDVVIQLVKTSAQIKVKCVVHSLFLVCLM